MAGKKEKNEGDDESCGPRIIKVSEKSDGTLEGMISDDQLIILLDKFMASNEAERWCEHRLIAHKQWKKWIDPSKLKTISDDDLKNNFLEYFNQGAGRHSFNPIYRARIVKDITRFRRSMEYLLNESVSMNDRLNQILDADGNHHIEGMGKGLATSILMDLNLEKYITWNNITSLGLEILGLSPEFERGSDWGSKYGKILEIAKHIRSLKPELGYLEIDHFLYFVTTDEGKDIVEAIKNNDLPNQEFDDKESMEFVMEKYLEEFIEANFDKIDFGAKLELYQDEEHRGRQYPTQIGRIDLLAVDKEKKEFLVMELKKGRSSDEVIGQILRYMGWVKEELAVEDFNDYNVSGVIILKKKDDKLEYALKVVSNVKVFLYTVSFELKLIT